MSLSFILDKDCFSLIEVFCLLLAMLNLIVNFDAMLIGAEINGQV